MFWNTKERYPLKSHLRKEHGMSIKKSEKYTLHECGICYFKKSREEFETHVSTVHPEFNMIVMLNRNAEPRLRPKFMICEFCKKDFTTSELAAAKLRSHVAYAHMSSRYVCVLCSFESGQKPSVYDHIEDTHIQPNLNKKEQKHFKRKHTYYKCSVCEIRQSSHYDILNHMKEHHDTELRKVKTQGSRGRRTRKDSDIAENAI